MKKKTIDTLDAFVYINNLIWLKEAILPRWTAQGPPQELEVGPRSVLYLLVIFIAGL